MSISFYDLCLRFQSVKHELTPARSLALNRLSQETEYTTLAINYSISPEVQAAPPPIDAFRRLTVKTNFKYMLPDIHFLSDYDLVAAAPFTDNEFRYCCEEGDCDIITFKLHHRLNLLIDKKVMEKAVDRGIMFEIVYAPADRDPESRTRFVNNAAKVIRATRGRNIVISSGSTDISQQRMPWEVLNMGCVLGMSVDQAQAAISTNPQKALEHAKARRMFKDIVANNSN